MNNKYLNKSKIIVIIATFLPIISACSSNNSNSSPSSSGQLTTDTISAIPIVNNQAASYAVYVKNLTNTSVSGLSFSINTVNSQAAINKNSHSGKFKTITSPTMDASNCTSIAANNSCKITFTSSIAGSYLVMGSVDGKEVIEFPIATYLTTVVNSGNKSNALILDNIPSTVTVQKNARDGYYGSVSFAVVNTYDANIDVTNLFSNLPTNVTWTPISCPNPLPFGGVCQVKLTYSGQIGSDVLTNLQPSGSIDGEKLPIQDSSGSVLFTKLPLATVNVVYPSLALDGNHPTTNNSVTAYLQNTGNSAATISAITINNNSINLFNISNNTCIGKLMPGVVCQYTITADVGVLSNVASGTYSNSISVSYQNGASIKTAGGQLTYTYIAKNSESNKPTVLPGLGIDGTLPSTVYNGTPSTIELTLTNNSTATHGGNPSITVNMNSLTANLGTGVTGTLNTTGISSNACSATSGNMVLDADHSCIVNLVLTVTAESDSEVLATVAPQYQYYVYSSTSTSSGTLTNASGAQLSTLSSEITVQLRMPSLALGFYDNNGTLINSLSVVQSESPVITANAILKVTNTGSAALTSISLPSIAGFTFTPEQSCSTLAINAHCDIAVSLSSSSIIAPTDITTDPSNVVSYAYNNGSASANGDSDFPSLVYQVTAANQPLISYATKFNNCGGGESVTHHTCNLNNGGSGAGTVGGYQFIVTFTNTNANGVAAHNFIVIPNTTPLASNYSPNVTNNCNNITLDGGASCTTIYTLNSNATSGNIDIGESLGTYSYKYGTGNISSGTVPAANPNSVNLNITEPTLTLNLTKIVIFPTESTTISATISSWYAGSIPSSVSVNSSNESVALGATITCTPLTFGCSGSSSLSGIDYGTTTLSSSIAAPDTTTIFASSAWLLRVGTVLYSFTDVPDGAYPHTALIQTSDGSFYGTTPFGGENNNGIVFKIESNGIETILHIFTGQPNDGSEPHSSLIKANNGSFYGTTQLGGANDLGTVFKIESNGRETILYSFAGGQDGKWPYASLIEDSNGVFYGTTSNGGENNSGTVFRIDSNGNETVLHSFGSGNDGIAPYANLIKAENGSFYGTTLYGGANGLGTVFKIESNGSETVLHSFSTSGDGAHPFAGLIETANGSFYGTTTFGGDNGQGTVFKIESNGSEMVLHSFGDGVDGQNPDAALLKADNGSFYSTTDSGGDNGQGTVFKIESNGSEMVLHSFTGQPNDGANPDAALIEGQDGYLYSTTNYGGLNNLGTIFILSK